MWRASCVSENFSMAADHAPSLSSLTMTLKVEYSHLFLRRTGTLSGYGKVKGKGSMTSIEKHLTANVTSAVQFLLIHQAVPPQSCRGNYTHTDMHTCL